AELGSEAQEAVEGARVVGGGGLGAGDRRCPVGPGVGAGRGQDRLDALGELCRRDALAVEAAHRWGSLGLNGVGVGQGAVASRDYRLAREAVAVWVVV